MPDRDGENLSLKFWQKNFKKSSPALRGFRHGIFGENLILPPSVAQLGKNPILKPMVSEIHKSKLHPLGAEISFFIATCQDFRQVHSEGFQ